jgi:type IX secretion system PorP/SprF family membrane protein
MQLSTFVAQEIQFTQFYAAPQFLNPAFTGLTYEHRFTANYRNQWPGIKRAFTTSMAAYDYNISNLNSGIGFFAIQDKAGSSNLVTTNFGGSFAYRFKIDKYSEMRGAISVAIGQKKIDNTTLIFNDQLISGNLLSQDALSMQSVNYIDLGAGALYNSTHYWIGSTIKHLNKPNTSLNGATSILPIYYSLHGGYRFILSSQGTGKTKINEFISASLNFRSQAKYAQLDIGAYYFKKIFTVGLWYRGLPFKKYKPGYPSRETLALLLGIEEPTKNFRIGYSYDVTISRLGINNTQGAHELSIVYEIAKKKKKNKRVLVSCPKF